MRSLAPQVIGVYEEMGLDPDSSRAIFFNIDYDADYSTACIESIECDKCNIYTEPHCATFVEDKSAALAEVPRTHDLAGGNS